MRPSKLTEKVLATFSEVLAQDHVMTVCTDEEICLLVNQHLEPEERISYRTFQRYKAKAMSGVDVDEVGEEMAELYSELYRLWRLAVIAQKRMLAESIQMAKTGWQRFKWLLEKKMQEWAEVPVVESVQTFNGKPVYKLGFSWTVARDEEGTISIPDNIYQRLTKLGTIWPDDLQTLDHE